ncbi:hypothetical protein BDV06DRAFT_220112 [Aspergillus oleicola]
MLTRGTITTTPFAPFLVLFYNVIQTQSLEDLTLLHSFVHSMTLASQASSALRKHQSLFQLFYDVAARYTELRVGLGSAGSPQEDTSGLQAEFIRISVRWGCSLGL